MNCIKIFRSSFRQHSQQKRCYLANLTNNHSCNITDTNTCTNTTNNNANNTNNNNSNNNNNKIATTTTRGAIYQSYNNIRNYSTSFNTLEQDFDSKMGHGSYSTLGNLYFKFFSC
eukprot:Pgem_evm1s11602